MKLSFDSLKPYAPPTLRIGISLVFLWFGVNQILFPSDFMGYLPLWAAQLPFFVLGNGIFETLFGLFLLGGFFTRTSCALLGLHLLGIIFTLGYNEVAIRDAGLLCGMVSILFNGPDRWSIDYLRK